MLFGVWLIYLCFGMTVVGLAPLVGPITRDLDISHGELGSIMGAWPLVYIASAIPLGAVMDRMGPRRALFLGAMVIAASGMLRGVSDSYLAMFLAVAAFGLGGPLISVGAPKVISLWFTGKERGLGMGVYFTGNAFGNIAALSLTNPVALPLAGGDWRLVLIGYGGITVVVACIWLLISAHPASRAMEERTAAERDKGQFQIFKELARVPVVQTIILMSVFMFFFNHALNNWLPEILRSTGMGADAAGYWASIPTAIGVIAALFIPRLAVRERRLIILLLLILGATAASLLLHSPPGPGLAAGVILQGIARGSMTTVSILVLMETDAVGAKRTGAASGMFFAAAEIGGVMGPLTLGATYDMTGGFSAGLYLLTGIALLLVLMWFRLRKLGV